MNIPKGEYQAKANQAKWVRSHETKRPGLLIEFAIQSPGPLEGRTFLAKPRYLSEVTRDRLEKAMRAMGWTGDRLSDLRGIGTKVCRITIKADQDTLRRDGSTNEVEVNFIDPLAGGTGVYEDANASDVDAILGPPRRGVDDMPEDGRFE